MRRMLVLISFSLAVFTIAPQAQTMDEILTKYYAAVNQEKLNTIQTVIMKGKVLQGGMEIPFNLYQKRPATLKTEATFQGMSIISVYDSGKGWMINPLAGINEPQPLPQEQLDEMKDQADMDGYLFNYEKKGYKLELLPEEDIEGVKAFLIKVTKPNGNEIVNFIDSESYVVLKMKAKVKVQGVERETETLLSNYKPVSEMVFPFNMETKMGGQTVVQIVVDSVEIDKDLPDSFFAKPEKK